MRKVLCLIAFTYATFSLASVRPFYLPWMNHPQAGTLYWSSDAPSGIFVIEAYYLNCPYCNDNAPNVDELTQEYKNEPRVQVLDVGIDKLDDFYKTWIEKHKPNHPVLKDDKKTVIGQLGTTGYPSTYVLDCKGKVVAQTSGVWDFAKKNTIKDAIDRLLKEDCQSIIQLPYNP